MVDLELLLREGMAELTDGIDAPKTDAPALLRRARFRRNGALLVGVVAVTALATVAALGVGPAAGGRASIQPGARQGFVPGGVEQTLTPTPLPPYWYQLTGRKGFIRPDPGTPRAFRVEGSPVFVTFDGTSAHRGVVNGPPHEPAYAFIGAGGASGSDGTQINWLPPSHVDVIADWPRPHWQVYIWPHLPAGTAVVTYIWQHTAYWERPVSGVAAFSMPRPAQFDGSFAQWHTAAIGELTAYDNSGHVLASYRAPRTPGDDLRISAN
jgi:hypothetical protein